MWRKSPTAPRAGDEADKILLLNPWWWLLGFKPSKDPKEEEL
jgi:hypothetical protein